MTMTDTKVKLYYALVMESGKVIVSEREYTETETEFADDEPSYNIPKLMNGMPSRPGYCRTPEDAVAFRVELQRQTIEAAKTKLAGAEAGLANLLNWKRGSLHIGG